MQQQSSRKRNAWPLGTVRFRDEAARASFAANLKWSAKLVLAALLAMLSASPLRAEGEVLTIAQQGNFYVGGHEVATADGSVIADAMFVEFQIPAKSEHPYPIVLIHGGASTGAGYWTTPDLREGWATQFVRKGYSVYVVDLPTNGRSPHYEPVDGPQSPPENVDSLQERITRPADFGLWPQARFANRFPGTGHPDDPAYRQLKARAQSSVETPYQDGEVGLAIRRRQDTIARDAVAQLLERIGPAILLTHSRSGATGWPIADLKPELVKAVVAIEPNGPPFYNAGSSGGAFAPRPAGISYLPLTFSPEALQPADFGALVQQPAEGPGLEGCWVPSGESPKLVNLGQLPVLVVVGQASYHASYDHCTAAFLRRAGVPVEFVRLEDRGITGNGHVMMGETNSDEIASLIADWLSNHVR